MKEATSRTDPQPQAESPAPATDRATEQAAETSSVGAPGIGAAPTPLMDRDFIARNQIVERYLSGKLPIKGATDFERFCREEPGTPG